VIVRHQKHVAAFTGAHIYYALPQQVIEWVIGTAVEPVLATTRASAYAF
jgi:hypothetical protein